MIDGADEFVQINEPDSDIEDNGANGGLVVELMKSVIKWCEINDDANQLSNLFDLRTKNVKTHVNESKMQTNLEN